MTAPSVRPRRAWLIRTLTVAAFFAVALHAAPAHAQIKAQARVTATPWTKGIVPISPETYYDAIACGKQGGGDPACVFWDTGLCKNPDFALALYTPYKSVAYEVWRVVQQKQPAPQPSYQEAQRTRITISITPVKGSTNPLTKFVLTRGGKAIEPFDRSLADGGGRYTFDYAAFAATTDITLDFVGKIKTMTCLIEQPILASFR